MITYGMKVNVYILIWDIEVYEFTVFLICTYKYLNYFDIEFYFFIIHILYYRIIIG